MTYGYPEGTPTGPLRHAVQKDSVLYDPTTGRPRGEGASPTPTAEQMGEILSAEQAMIRVGWVAQCSYVGLGRCQRAEHTDLPHLTDPSKE